MGQDYNPRHYATFIQQTNATAINAGTSVGGTAIVSTSTPFREAIVVAQKKGAAATNPPAANTGIVYLCSATTTLVGAIPLDSGDVFALPKNGDLADYYLAVASANDGIVILYTPR